MLTPYCVIVFKFVRSDIAINKFTEWANFKWRIHSGPRYMPDFTEDVLCTLSWYIIIAYTWACFVGAARLPQGESPWECVRAAPKSSSYSCNQSPFDKVVSLTTFCTDINYASVGGAPEAYGSRRVCLCICVSVCLSRALITLCAYAQQG